MTVFQVIAAEEANFPVIMMCEILEVSRSGYYAWKVREPSARSQENTALAQEVAEIHAASRKTYGSPRIRSELRERGRRVSRKRVARLMRQEGIQGRRRPKFRKTTDSNHKLPVAENVLDDVATRLSAIRRRSPTRRASTPHRRRRKRHKKSVHFFGTIPYLHVISGAERRAIDALEPATGTILAPQHGSRPNISDSRKNPRR